MLPKLFWSILLHPNLLCAASYLDNFSKVLDASEFYAQHFEDHGAFRVKCVQQTNICAEQCFLDKYFCNSFSVVLHDSTLYCHPSEIQVRDITLDDMPTSYTVITLFNIKEPRNKVVDELSRNEGSMEEWTDEIIKGYSLSAQENFWKPFLLGCRNSALNGPPASAVDFKGWLERNGVLSAARDTGEPKNKRFKPSPEVAQEYKTSIAEEISVGLKSWSGYRGSSDLFDIMALTFLDIFSHNIVGQAFTTLFDPIRKSLFIHGENLYLLIVSDGKGYYVMIHDTSVQNFALNIPSIYQTGFKQGIPYESAWEMFEGAVHILDNQAKLTKPVIPHRFSLEYDYGNKKSALDVVFQATHILLQPTGFGDDAIYSKDTRSRKCLSDMMTLVLSRVYGKNMRSTLAQSRSLESKVRKDFRESMIDIITFQRPSSQIGNGT